MPNLISTRIEHLIEIEKIKYLINLTETPKYYATVTDNNKLIGFAVLSESTLQHLYDLTWVCIDPEYRNQGIGKKLVAKAIEFCKEKDRNIVITTEQTKFYTDLGFTICNEFKPGWYLMSTTTMGK